MLCYRTLFFLRWVSTGDLKLFFSSRLFVIFVANFSIFTPDLLALAEALNSFILTLYLVVVFVLFPLCCDVISDPVELQKCGVVV